MHQHAIARHAEQIGAEARVHVTPIDRLHAVEEHPLRQVLGGVGQPDLEEPAHRGVVPGDERVAGRAVSAAPTLQQLEIAGLHRHRAGRGPR